MPALEPQGQVAAPAPLRCWGLLRRRQCLVPTWRGILLLGVVVLGLLVGCGPQLHPFLAVNELVPGGCLVAEGWASDIALMTTVKEFRTHHYDKVFVTGGPLERGAPLSEYRTFAELGAATLLKMGLTTNEVQAVPSPAVRQDRTFASSVALRQWIRDHNFPLTRLQLVTGGPHARRSRLLFAKALGSGVQVGVTAVPPQDYDETRWWLSSAGVRTTLGEAIAYAYVRLLFRGSAE